MIRHLLTEIGFLAGGSGPYTSKQKTSTEIYIRKTIHITEHTKWKEKHIKQ